MAQKIALSVQSLACHGKCSLTEALPIVSARGISLSVLPTVLLSTHTGGFTTPAKVDTTEFLEKSIEHFCAEEIKFDGIYTGYFADKKQIELFTEKLDLLKNDKAIVLVDPVLGDNGKFFSGIDDSFLNSMLKICSMSDVILPNITEAFFLCGEKYKEKPSEDEVFSLAVKLYNLTKAKVVITGFQKDGKIGALIFDGDNTELILNKKISVHFHGTGDMFAALVFASILNGKNLKQSVRDAQKFVAKSIRETVKLNIQERNGINFESNLKNYWKF